MRETEIIIRLQLPAAPRKRWLIALSGFILTAGAIAYAMVPNTFKMNDTLSSKLMNDNFTALDMRVTSLEGRVSTLEAPVSASYYLQTGQTIPSGGDALNTIVFDTSLWDTNGAYTTKGNMAGTYTVPMSGKYLVTGRVSLTNCHSTNSFMDFGVTAGGKAYNIALAHCFSTGATPDSTQGVIAVNLNKGDTVTLWGSQTDGDTLTIAGVPDNSYFSIIRIGN